MKQIQILGVPLDLGAGRRGVDMGASAIRLAGLVPRLRALGHSVRDCGNVQVPGADALLTRIQDKLVEESVDGEIQETGQPQSTRPSIGGHC